jgi:hypothetical protein
MAECFSMITISKCDTRRHKEAKDVSFYEFVDLLTKRKRSPPSTGSTTDWSHPRLSFLVRSWLIP